MEQKGKMPKLKPVFIKHNQTRKPEAGLGKDLLKMSKYFPSLEFTPSGAKGCFVTRVLMDGGYIWIKKTKLRPARGIPGGFREREWKIEGYSILAPETLKFQWYKEGWTLSSGYRVGPSVRSKGLKEWISLLKSFPPAPEVK